MDFAPLILFVDNDLLVVNKPSGLLSIPDGYDSDKPYLQGLLEPRHGKLWIVHRLDKETSGLVLLARNAEAHRHLNEQFSTHRVEKTYRAIVVGVPAWDKMESNKGLRSNVGRRKRTIIDTQYGKPAKTAFRVIKRYRNHALIEAQPKTGRTHQIRVHLYDLGYPILSDPLYGDGDESPLINRLALHARAMVILHPTLDVQVSFQAEEAQDFVCALTALAK